jgi:hypothetical protein
VNCCTVPNCRERLGEGVRLMVTGNTEEPAGLCPPQAGKNQTESDKHSGNSEDNEILVTTRSRCSQGKLPMHPLVAQR